MAENYYYSSLSGDEIEQTLLGAVRFNTDQSLTTSQKAAARANIGAGEANSTFKVLGYFNTLAEMQAALQTLPELGDAYGIGTESPYDVYVYAMHMVGDQAVPGWVNQGPIDTSAAAFDDNDISTRTGWTSSKIASELTNVQRRLVIDDVPTLGSGNPVASGGVAVKMEWKKIVSENVSVPVNRWASSAKYDGYGFRAQIPIENVTADMIPEVIFDPADVSTGTFATIAESYNGGIYIYASEVPSAAITIPTIIVWRGDTGDGSDIPLIQIDPTLTVAGDAADAKAAGDAIRANATAIDAMQTSVDNKAGALVDTASGAIASFVPDATIDHLLGLDVNIEPVQDLHGQGSPWPGGGGKNLFPLPTTAETKSGVTVEATTSGEIWVHGTPTITSGYISFALSQITSAIIGQQTTISINEKIVGVGFDTNISGGMLTFAMSDTATVKTGMANSISGAAQVNVRYDVGTIDKKFKIQLEISASPTAWAPYSNICPISGRTSATVTRTGVNVWDEEVEDGYITSNGGLTPYTNAIRSKNYSSCKPSTSYCHVHKQGMNGCTVAWYDSNKTFIERVVVESSDAVVITSPSNAYYFKLSFFNYKVQDAESYAHDVSFNYPSTDHDYHAYVGTTYPIPLGQTVYGGTLDVVNGVLTVDMAAGVFDGSENITWQITADGSTRQNVYCNVHDKYRDIITTGGLARFEINIFKAITNRADRVQYTAYLDNGYLNMQFPSGMFSSVAELKSWLSANNVQFTYPLATPVTYTLTPQQIATLTGQNNVWADAGDVTVEYAADLKAYIDRLNQPTEDDMIANTLIAANKYFTVNNRLFLSTASIAAGAQIIPGTNCTETSLVEALNALNA